MKARFLLTMIFSLLLTGVFAQGRGANGGHLTIVSEEGQTFYLHINGVQYNRTPALAVRVENINSTVVDVRVVFAQGRNAALTYKSLPIADFEGYMQDITYSVNSKRRGERAFMVYHVIPLTPIQVDARDIQVFNQSNPSNQRP